MNRILSAMKWCAATTGAAVPAWAFFEHTAPPLFRQIGLILTAVNAAIIIVVASYLPSPVPTGGSLPPMVRTAVKLILASLVLLIAYVVLWGQWTIPNPNDGSTRYQIGFSGWRVGLTEEGIRDLQDPKLHSIADWVNACACYSDEGVHEIWKGWAIDLAGTTLIVLFVGGFVTWSLGFSLLAKYKSKVE